MAKKIYLIIALDQSTVNKYIRDFVEIYYCTVFLVYSAAFLMFFWELQSLLLRFSLSDILGFLSYQVAFALLESFVVAVFTLMVVSVIPIQQVRDHRSVVGCLFVFSFAISAWIFKERTNIIQWLYQSLFISQTTALQIVMFVWFFTLFALPVVSILMMRTTRPVTRIKSFIENLAVLANLYTAVSVIGVLVVIYRNLA